MKKVYVKPCMLTQQVTVQKIICASDPGATINPNGSVEAGSIDSRRSSTLWDDDEEE